MSTTSSSSTSAMLTAKAALAQASDRLADSVWNYIRTETDSDLNAMTTALVEYHAAKKELSRCF